jgi:hypothetical protein
MLNGDMPFAAGRKALVRLSNAFALFDKNLDRAIRLKDNANISSLANNINVKILEVLPILGFILRSTNVRNAFELIEPLQAIADAAMQGRPELILSSEWDYIPFAYPQSLDDLKSYVLIGLPASEAASALLVPLAGHELGHAVWRNRGLSSDIQLTLDAQIAILFDADLSSFKKIFSDYDPDDVFKREMLPDSKSQALEYAEYQAEEMFCDLFGYALFGASYLHAFAFILAPGVGGRYRSGKYPAYSKRIQVISDVAKAEGISLPNHSELSFAQDLRGFDDRHRFVVKIADDAASTIVPALWEKVLRVINEAKILRPLAENANRHVRDLRLGIPASKPECLGDILNAGWLRYEEIVKSMKLAEVSDELDRLNEVLLKTIEVSEYRRKIG